MAEEKEAIKAGDAVLIKGTVLNVHGDETVHPSNRSLSIQTGDGQQIWTNFANVSKVPEPEKKIIVPPKKNELKR